MHRRSGQADAILYHGAVFYVNQLYELSYVPWKLLLMPKFFVLISKHSHMYMTHSKPTQY